MNKFLKSLWLPMVLLLLAISTQALSSEPITPLPTAITVDKDKVALGRKLFFDTRLSADDSISCASCHHLNEGGAENTAVSTGIKGLTGERNAPTVYNAAYNFTQFWDGRSEGLAHQALQPITNPVEMGMSSLDEAISKLNNIPEYKNDFQRIYGAAISAEFLGDAIAEFEKTLNTPNSPFDRYLAGDKLALTGEQKRGYNLFKAYGCVACHQGKNVGGNMYQKFGVLKDINLYPGDLSKDLGRYNVTGNEWDKRVFKVPSLRLAVLTAPYFHNGSVASINEAVDIMIKFQLGRDVPKNDKNAIIAFLGSLVGEFPQGVK